MKTDDQYYTGDKLDTPDKPDKRKTPKRTWVYAVLIFLILWITLSHHVILVSEGPAVVVLTKASWGFSDSYINEHNWSGFRSQFPVLAERLMTGDGWWLFGELEE